jgi:hypothetical protein
MKQEAEDRMLHRMAKVHNGFKMWQGSENLRASPKESRDQNKQVTAGGYISDTEQIVKASWSFFQHDGAAAFKLSERSPLPPALSKKDIPGGRTKILNGCRIPRINIRPVEINKDSTPESFSDTDEWLNGKGDLDNPNNSKEDCAADNECDIEQYTCIEVSEYSEHQNVSAATNVPGLVRTTREPKRQAE